jgi:hypothetical protein
MLRTKLAKKVLTKKEQKHLTESNIHSLRDLRRQGDFMKKLNPDDPGQVCRECQHIINKLANVEH